MACPAEHPIVISGRDFVRIWYTPLGGGDGWLSWPMGRQHAETHIERDRVRQPGREYRLVEYPACVVCGQVSYDESTNRCYTHRGRTPCSIEGCTRNRKFDGWISDGGNWICGDHWKLVCPPRSALRRTYLRFFRIARRLGVENGRWPADLERRYWRFFNGLIARFHRRVNSEAAIDVDEINRMFGWSDA